MSRPPLRVATIPYHILRTRRSRKATRNIKQEVSIFKLAPLTDVSLTTLINETLARGNIHRILSSNLVTATDVLKYILTERPHDILMEVYRAACIYGGDAAHIIDGQHFLVSSNNEKYKYIYTMYCPQAKDMYKPLSAVPKINNTYHLIMDSIKDSIKDSLPIHMREDGIELLEKSGEWDTIYSYRLKPLCEKSAIHIEVAIRNEYYEVLLDYDLQSQSKILTKLIVELCFSLRSTTTLYWSLVAQPTISKFIIFLKQKYGTEYFNLECRLELYPYFPQLFNFEELSTLQKSIISMECRQLQGYYLGYPIHDYVPNISEIYSAVIKLGQLGIETYCEQIINSNKAWIESICRHHLLPHLDQNDLMLQPDNIIDLVAGASIYTFCPFDIIFCQSGKSRYAITRLSFDYTLKNGENPYNRKPLTPRVINCLRHRLKVAKKYNLPDCQTLRESLHDLEINGYTSHINTVINERNITRSPHILTPHILTADFAAFLQQILGQNFTIGRIHI